MSDNKKQIKIPLTSTAAQDNQIVCVEVGQAKKKYYLHKALLMAHSEYFQGALSGNWKRGKTIPLITLEEWDTTPFNIFVNWIYSERIPDDPYQVTEMTGLDAAVIENRHAIAFEVVRAAHFADFALMKSGIQAAIEDWLMSCYAMSMCPPYCHVVYAFENLPDDHPLLDWYVRRFADSGWQPWDEEANGNDGMGSELDLPALFLLRVIKRRKEAQTQQNERWAEIFSNLRG